MTGRLHPAVCALCLCLAGCSPSTDFERMRQQPRAEPFAASQQFPNGMAMRVPPAGTVPVAPRGAAEDTTGGPHDFEIFCAVCHGADGSGRSVMSSNMPGPPPPSLVSSQAAALTNEALFEIVSRGKNHMPAYAWALPASERTAVVDYVRTLQRSGHTAAGGPAR